MIKCRFVKIDKDNIDIFSKTVSKSDVNCNLNKKMLDEILRNKHLAAVAYHNNNPVGCIAGRLEPFEMFHKIIEIDTFVKAGNCLVSNPMDNDMESCEVHSSLASDLTKYFFRDDLCLNNDDLLYIVAIAVLPSFRREGIGSQMLSWILDQFRRQIARNYEKPKAEHKPGELEQGETNKARNIAFLHCWEGNLAAKYFYKERRFSEVRTCPQFYPHLRPSNAILFVHLDKYSDHIL